MHGHALGASGSLELIAVIEAIRRGIIPPTINIEELDPECDLDVTSGCARARPIHTAVSVEIRCGVGLSSAGRRQEEARKPEVGVIC
jgi:3-oxoacyl-(acyl-carrier-protein) synthase